MIVRNLDSKIYSSSNYNLIAEDNIQNIISANVFPEVPLVFQHNFIILLISTKKITSLKRKLNKFLRNISWKCSVKRYQESFVHLSPCIKNQKSKKSKIK